MKLFANNQVGLSPGFIQSTIIYIPIFLCDSGIGKHFESVKKEHKHKPTQTVR